MLCSRGTGSSGTLLRFTASLFDHSVGQLGSIKLNIHGKAFNPRELHPCRAKARSIPEKLPRLIPCLQQTSKGPNGDNKPLCVLYN